MCSSFARGIEICLANYAASLAAREHILIFFKKTLVAASRPGAYPEEGEGGILRATKLCFSFLLPAFDSSFTCKYRDAVLPPLWPTLFFSLTPAKFPSPCRLTRIFRVEITSRSPLYLESLQAIPRQSFKQFLRTSRKSPFSLVERTALSPEIVHFPRYRHNPRYYSSKFTTKVSETQLNNLCELSSRLSFLLK